MEKLYDTDPQVILERMKDSVPNDLNKEEGSITHDTLTGSSEELGYCYSRMNELVNRVFTRRALENGYSRELELKCGEVGLIRKPGKKATGLVTFSGEVGTLIPKGVRVHTKRTGLKYITVKDEIIPETGFIDVNIEAEDIGSIYNTPMNTITELEIQIIGITSLTNNLDIADGVNVETDQELWDRYLEKLQNPTTSGNPSHYKQWALEVQGIGDARVIPTWDGGGTVKVILLDTNKRAPAPELITNTFNHIESVRPVGATPTVVGATELKIDISVKVQLKPSKDIPTVKKTLSEGATQYLASIAFKEDVVRYNKITGILLDMTDIVDFFDLTINLGSININVPEDSVAVLGEVTVLESI